MTGCVYGAVHFGRRCGAEPSSSLWNYPKGAERQYNVLVDKMIGSVIRLQVGDQIVRELDSRLWWLLGTVLWVGAARSLR